MSTDYRSREALVPGRINYVNYGCDMCGRSIDVDLKTQQSPGDDGPEGWVAVGRYGAAFATGRSADLCSVNCATRFLLGLPSTKFRPVEVQA